MTDLSARTAEELAEKVRAWALDPGRWGEVVDELVRRASERDQAMRERDDWKQEAREWADASLENGERADRLAAALEQIASGKTARPHEVIASDALAADQEQT